MAADNHLLLHTLLVSMGARHTCSIQPCMQAKHPYTNNQTGISLHYILGTLNNNSIHFSIAKHLTVYHGFHRLGKHNLKGFYVS